MLHRFGCVGADSNGGDAQEGEATGTSGRGGKSDSEGGKGGEAKGSCGDAEGGEGKNGKNDGASGDIKGRECKGVGPEIGQSENLACSAGALLGDMRAKIGEVLGKEVGTEMGAKVGVEVGGAMEGVLGGFSCSGHGVESEKGKNESEGKQPAPPLSPLSLLQWFSGSDDKLVKQRQLLASNEVSGGTE